MGNATPENCARTWRNVADQLTAGEAALLARAESDPRVSDAGLLTTARSMAGDHIRQQVYADVLVPADATSAAEWIGGRDGGVSRYFTGTLRGSTVGVAIIGDQLGDGSTTDRRIFVNPGSDGAAEIDAATARAIAADLLAAADELDALTAGVR